MTIMKQLCLFSLVFIISGCPKLSVEERDLVRDFDELISEPEKPFSDMIGPSRFLAAYITLSEVERLSIKDSEIMQKSLLSKLAFLGQVRSRR